MTHLLGPQVTVASFTDQDSAERAWIRLMDAGIGAVIVTDPGIFGQYNLAVMVERDDETKALRLLAEEPA